MSLVDLPVRVAPGTRRRALLAGVLALPLALVAPPAVLLVPALVALVVWFNRDPQRTPPESGFVSPADGRVSVVREEEDDGETRVRVGVFMNVTDVHVNRAPAPGTVESVEHSPGRHLPAFTKGSDRNERVVIDCGGYEVTLIAGAVARRIHPLVEPHERLDRGERIGHITLGSRADVLFPPGTSLDDVRVERGEKVRAGETVLADR
ncbi:MAG: protein sorting system archaetidylserine decarboxylase [Haloarculaceae archaeon]